MTREQRRLRRQWITVYLILSAAILVLAGAIVWAQPWEQEELVREPYNPPYEVFTKGAINAIEYPTKHYYRQDIPLDRYLQETLWNACQEWDVPYELALAVCWRETNYRNLITEADERTYYGMMAVQLESAGWYMEQCGVEYLNSEEDRLRVACCILGQHLKDYESTYAALCRYSNDYEGWYAESVLEYMDGLKGGY